MNLIALDGLYPTNAAYNLAPLIVILFEIIVVTIEVTIICRLLDKGKDFPFNRIAVAVIIANMATFALGATIDLWIGNFIIYAPVDLIFIVLLVSSFLLGVLFMVLFPHRETGQRVKGEG